MLSVLAGEVSIAEAARREKVSEQSIGRLEAEVAELTQALNEAHLETRVWKKSAEGRLGPSQDLRGIRITADMSTARFCQLFEVPERTWRRKQAKARTATSSKGPWPRPARQRGSRLCAQSMRWLIQRGDTERTWAMVRHDGHVVSKASVLRILRDEALILPAQYQRERRRLAERRDACVRHQADAPESGMAAGLHLGSRPPLAGSGDWPNAGTTTRNMSIGSISLPPPTSTTRSSWPRR